jgi:hypothetical protein
MQLPQIVHAGSQIGLGAALINRDLSGIGAGAARTALLNCSPQRDNDQPSRGVDDLLAIERCHVEPLPRLGVARFQISQVELTRTGAKPRPHRGEHLCAQALEIAFQQALCTKAA